MAHNVDSTSLNQLIESFRVLQTKDSITPDSLGALLKRISDLLATAGLAVSIDTLMQWYNSDAPKIELMRQQILDIGHIRPRDIFPKAQIACLVHGDRLYIHGAKKLTEAGYVPYIFRNIRKGSLFKDFDRESPKKFSRNRKGWTLFGSYYAYRMNGGVLEISTKGPLSFQSAECAGGTFTTQASALVTVSPSRSKGDMVAWGRTRIPLTNGSDSLRTLRLEFGIGFAKPITPCRRRVTLADLASSFARFTVMHTADGRWIFSRS